MTDGDVEQRLPPGLALAWGVTPGARRGPKPAYTVGQIVGIAMELADQEGFAALSMPKIASQLGITANALYRYVSSKDELLVLLADTGWGPPPSTLRDSVGWREGGATWVRAVIDRYRVHPWLLDLPVRGAPMTPNLLRWFEAVLGVLADSGLGDQDTVRCAMLLDGYARSTAHLGRDLARSATPTVDPAATGEFLLSMLREHDFPILTGIMSGGAYGEEGLSDEDVEFGLERILDGIEVLIGPSRPD